MAFTEGRQNHSEVPANAYDQAEVNRLLYDRTTGSALLEGLTLAEAGALAQVYIGLRGDANNPDREKHAENAQNRTQELNNQLEKAQSRFVPHKDSVRSILNKLSERLSNTEESVSQTTQAEQDLLIIPLAMAMVDEAGRDALAEIESEIDRLREEARKADKEAFYWSNVPDLFAAFDQDLRNGTVQGMPGIRGRINGKLIQPLTQ